MRLLTRSSQLLVSRGRWAIALALIILHLVLAQASIVESTQRRHLGLRAIRSDGEIRVDRVQPAGWAWDAGIRPGDVVLSVDSQPTGPGTDVALVASASQVEARSPSGALRSAPAGAPPIPVTPLHQGSFIVLAFSLLAIGALVFVVARDLASASALLGLTTAAATMLDSALAQPSGAEWALVATFVSLAAFGGWTLGLFALFPVRRTNLAWVRLLLMGALVGHVSLIAGYGWVLLVDTSLYDFLKQALLSILALDFLFAIAFLGSSLLRPSERHQSRQILQLLVVGCVVSLAPFFLLSVLPYAVGLDYLVPADITILSLLALPASIGAALVSRQFLGATRLVRRGLVALGVWIALLAAYAIVWNLATAALPAATAITSLVESPVLAIAIIASSFPFAQHWLRRAIERSLFRDVYDYAGTLRAISEELVHLSETEPIARHVLSRLGQTLDLSWAAITLPGLDEHVPYEWRAGDINESPPSPPTIGAGIPPYAQDEVAARIPLLVERNQIGDLLMGPKLQDIELLPEDLQLVETLAPMVATALQNAVLLEQLQEQIEILSEREGQLAALSSRLMEVHEEERSRLALDLHDDPLQRALLLARQLSEAKGQLGTVAWRREAEDIVQSLKAICAGLRPPTLEDFGLPAGLDWLLDEVGARSEIVGSLNVVSAEDGFGRLDLDLELALYRVGQEALTNCVKHSSGTQVSVELRRTPYDVTLEVQDDGLGYETTRNSGIHGAQSGLHLGIMGMRERLRPWNGSVDIESAPGRGTLVRARVPLEETDGRQN